MSWLNPFSKNKSMAKDPVCGMNVDPAKTNLTMKLDGKDYYFCAPSCMKAFTANPAKYLGGGAAGMNESKDQPAHHDDHGGMGGKRHGCC